MLRVEVARSLRQVVADAGDTASRSFRAFAAGMDVGAKGDLAQVHRRIAANARDAIRAEYEYEVDSVRTVEPYKRFNRLSGQLGKVVRRRDLVRGDAEGVHFIDAGTLDKEAAHWRRVNFGAGSQAGEQPAPIPIRLFGEALQMASFDIGPSRGFSLPKGFFIQGGRAVIPNSNYRGAGSVGPFIPNRKSPYRPAPTEGIRGRHFLEAGLESMRHDFPNMYADLLAEWIARGSRKAKAIQRVLG